jgi:hypothetical protein
MLEEIHKEAGDHLRLLLLRQVAALRDRMGDEVAGHFPPDLRHVEHLADRIEVGAPQRHHGASDLRLGVGDVLDDVLGVGAIVGHRHAHRARCLVSPHNPHYVQVRGYLGEAYLVKGDVASAKAELQAIRHICGTTCEAYEHLAVAIADPADL